MGLFFRVLFEVIVYLLAALTATTVLAVVAAFLSQYIGWFGVLLGSATLVAGLMYWLNRKSTCCTRNH